MKKMDITKLIPAEGRPMLTYIERVKRKKQNKKDRAILLRCFGDDISDNEESSDSDKDDQDESE